MPRWVSAESFGECQLDAHCQCRVVHLNRDIFAMLAKYHAYMRHEMLKIVPARQDREAVRAVSAKFTETRLRQVAARIRASVAAQAADPGTAHWNILCAKSTDVCAWAGHSCRTFDITISGGAMASYCQQIVRREARPCHDLSEQRPHCRNRFSPRLGRDDRHENIRNLLDITIRTAAN